MEPQEKERLCLDCGITKPLDKNHFTYTSKFHKEKQRRVIYFNWRCRICYNLTSNKDVIRTGRSHGMRRDLHHTGPVGIEYIFFCKLPIVRMAQEIRETRRYTLVQNPPCSGGRHSERISRNPGRAESKIRAARCGYSGYGVKASS